jgi:hypothetical protein
MVRDELLLQRRLGKSRRAASALLPTVQRTGLNAKPDRLQLRIVNAKHPPVVKTPSQSTSMPMRPKAHTLTARGVKS